MNKKAQYLVTKQSCCKDCEGSGVIASKEWEEFSVYYEDKLKKLPFAERDQLEDEFWREKGYYNESPPEEYICPECEGTGKIIEQIDLRQALAEIHSEKYEIIKQYRC